jgi:hypothetical protein
MDEGEQKYMKQKVIGIPGDDLPPDRFLSLVGTFSHVSCMGKYGPFDENHIFAWVLNPDTGLVYECSVHTRLTYLAEMQISFLYEEIGVEGWPQFGLVPEPTLCYSQLGIEDSHFRCVGQRPLRQELRSLGDRSDRIQIYGRADADGSTIHDVHFNCGEPPHVTRTSRTHQDGAMAFYRDARPGLPAHRVWAFLKFQAQSVARASSH